MRAAPLSPRSMASQKASTERPIGVSAPMPVTTTLRCAFGILSYGKIRLAGAKRIVTKRMVGYHPDTKNPVITSSVTDKHRVLRLGSFFSQIANGVAHRCDLFGILVRDGKVKLFFKLHDEFDGVERVGTEVVGKRGISHDVGFFHAQLFYDDR